MYGGNIHFILRMKREEWPFAVFDREKTRLKKKDLKVNRTSKCVCVAESGIKYRLQRRES